MSKIHKVYPPFFNGVSQQKPELVLDNQCKEMVNCVPDLVLGLTKRPPVKFQAVRDFTTYPELTNARVFHVYDRGEDNEEYIMLETDDAAEPVQVFNKAGVKMTVAYNPTNAATIKAYLANRNLKGLTVQDRTWIFSKTPTVTLDYSATAPLDTNYTKVAYYWIKRGSGDRYNPFNYAVYLDGYVASCNPQKPAIGGPDPLDLQTGFEDSDYAARYLADIINGDENVTARYKTGQMLIGDTVDINLYLGAGLTGVSWVITALPTSYSGTLTYSSTTGYLSGTLTKITDSGTLEVNATGSFPSGFTAEAQGSIIKIYKTDNSDFTFSSWDSWGNQASEGWKGSVNKISDLPKDINFTNIYIKVLGDETNTFTEYFVKWNGSSWEECLDPEADRGQLTNMPVKMDRTSLVAGIATFTFDLVDWSLPRVGNTDNNPDPSFTNRQVHDLFFYKNRLGIASEDSISLTEAANYTNWYATTVLDIVDTDVIDITIATNQASKVYYAKPFNNSLYIFTKYAQYELVSEGAFSPATVSLDNTSNYPMATDVEPVVVNDSLYFISTTDNQQQLREYIKTDKLSVKGIDLNVSTPTYLAQPIKKLIADGVLGYVLCCTADNIIYLYNFKEDGTNRIQSAWSTWSILGDLTYTSGSYEYASLSSTVLAICKTANDYRYHQLQLDYNVANDNEDTSSDGTTPTTHSYEAKIVLPDYYPKLSEMRTPLNKMLIKRVVIEGEGSFDADVYRKDYDKTYTKSHTYSMADLDLYVSSKVGNVEITIKDSSINDFTISSVVIEGLFNTTSREMR